MAADWHNLKGKTLIWLNFGHSFGVFAVRDPP